MSHSAKVKALWARIIAEHKQETLRTNKVLDRILAALDAQDLAAQERLHNPPERP